MLSHSTGDEFAKRISNLCKGACNGSIFPPTITEAERRWERYVVEAFVFTEESQATLR